MSQYGVGGGDAESGFTEYKGGLSTPDNDLIDKIKGGALKLGNGCIIKLSIEKNIFKVSIQLVFPGLVPKQNPDKPHKNAQLLPNRDPTIIINDERDFDAWKAKFAPDLQDGVTDIYFIRHGEGMHNEAGDKYGPGFAPHDAPLTTKGKIGAAAAGIWLESANISNIVLVGVSDLIRTTQTAWFATRFIASHRFADFPNKAPVDLANNPPIDFANLTKNKFVVLPSNYEMNDVAGNEGTKCKSFGIVGAHSMGISYISKTGENTPFYFFGDNPRCKTYDNFNKLSNLWTFGASIYSLAVGMKGLNEREANLTELTNQNPSNCRTGNFKLMVLVVSLFDTAGSIPCKYDPSDSKIIKAFRLMLDAENIVGQQSQVEYPSVDWSLYFAFWYQSWQWYSKNTGQQEISRISTKTGLSYKCLSNRRQFRLYHTSLKINPTRVTNMIQSAIRFIRLGSIPESLMPPNSIKGGKRSKRRKQKNKKTHKHNKKHRNTRKSRKRGIKRKTKARK